MKKPVVELDPVDGDLLALVDAVAKALEKAGQTAMVEVMKKEVMKAGSYYQGLSIVQRYVETA
jgi:hypothetical protein